MILGWILFTRFFAYNLVIYPYNFPIFYAISAFLWPLSITMISHGIRILKILGTTRLHPMDVIPKKSGYFLFLMLILVCFPVALFCGLDNLVINAVQIMADVGYEAYYSLLVIWIGSVLWFIYIFIEAIGNARGKPIFLKRWWKRQKSRSALNIYERVTHIQLIGRLQSIMLILMVIMALGSVGGVTLAGDQRCEFFEDSFFTSPAYSLPSGSHYNGSLDALSGYNSSILTALEKSLWKFTTLQRAGGFPLGSTIDGTLMWSDRGKMCPLMEGEFSIQGGTPPTGEIYLKMYQLEPNPIYLSVAESIANALIAVQDDVNGGWYHEGRRYSSGAGYQPHTHNARRAAVLDDNTMQSTMTFLLHIYNETADPEYLNALHKGFDCLADMEKKGGGWPQKSNYGRDAYEHYVTLNDNCMYDVVNLLWEGYNILPDRSDLFDAVKRAGNFLIRVQGNGGSALQDGWAQQYDENDQPAWARAFEPPAICSSQTARAIEILMELYLNTGNLEWLIPIPDAIAWLNSSSTKLDDNTWARLYELVSNKPIYGIQRGGPYQNPMYVYELENARSGYSWQGNYGISYTMQKWLKLRELGYDIDAFLNWRDSSPSTDYLQSIATGAMNSLNDDGWWVSNGEISQFQFTSNAVNMISFLERAIG